MCNEVARRIASDQHREDWSELKVPLVFPEGLSDLGRQDSIRIAVTALILRALERRAASCDPPLENDGGTVPADLEDCGAGGGGAGNRCPTSPHPAYLVGPLPGEDDSMTDLTATLVTRGGRAHPSAAHDPIEEVERVLREGLDLLDRNEPIPDVDVPPTGGDGKGEAPPRPRLAAPGWTPARQRAFIDHLATSGCVTHAARAVGLSKQSAYQLRDRSPNSIFALAWSVAIARSRRLILDQATEVALAGREVSLVYRGQEIGSRTIHSDRLMMFLLGLKREPLHPALTEHELAELWPAMLEEIDAILPSTLTPERMATLGVGDA